MLWLFPDLVLTCWEQPVTLEINKFTDSSITNGISQNEDEVKNPGVDEADLI